MDATPDIEFWEACLCGEVDRAAELAEAGTSNYRLGLKAGCTSGKLNIVAWCLEKIAESKLPLEKTQFIVIAEQSGMHHAAEMVRGWDPEAPPLPPK